MTFKQLTKLAGYLGVTVVIDDCDLRVTAPDGFCFEPGLHELVECILELHPSCYPATWRKRALQEAIDRMYNRLEEETLEPCTDPNCDWCLEQCDEEDED